MAKRILEIEGRLVSANSGINTGPSLANAVTTAQTSREISWTSALATQVDNDKMMLEGWVYYENNAVTIYRCRNSGFGLQHTFSLDASGLWNANMDRANFGTHYAAGLTVGSRVFPSFTWIQMLVASDLSSVGDPKVDVAFSGIVVPDTSWNLDTRNGGTQFSFNDPPAATHDSYLAVAAHTVSRFYLSTGIYLPLTSAANIAKFIDTSDHYKPVQLGADGSNPTGSQPLFFMPNEIATILTNLGTARDADALDGVWTASGHNPTSPGKFAHLTAAAPNQSGLELTGAALSLADTQQISLSFWFKTALTTTAGELVICSDGSASERFMVTYDGSGVITVAARNAAGTLIFSGVSTGIDISTTTWQHIAIAINMQAATGADAFRLTIDGVDAKGTVGTFVGSGSINLAQTGLSFALFNLAARAAATTGEFSQFWCAPGQFVDFEDSAIITKFVRTSPSLAPVELGTDGSTPTGTAPLIYIGEGPTFIDGSPYHNVNLGSSGGTFTVSRNAWISPVTHPPAQTFF